jgi:hypothetical protein
VLHGEPLETLACELNVTVARLSEWRDRALVGAEAAMKERERDSRDEELLHLKAKLGDCCARLTASAWEVVRPDVIRRAAFDE